MKKLFLFILVWLYPIVGFSAIDERKTDIYFANGIKTSIDEAQKNAEKVLEPAIKVTLYGGVEKEMKNHIGKVDYAYNETHDMFADEDGWFDLIESFFQKTNFQELLDNWIVDKSYQMVQTSHARDLKLQVEKYKASIEEGHKVVVVAHSQGNLFTYEAYRKLDSWMQDYFYAVSVASPGHYSIKEDTPRVSWDNDLVAQIGLYDDFVPNPVRVTKWVPLDDSTIPPFESPTHSFDKRGQATLIQSKYLKRRRDAKDSSRGECRRDISYCKPGQYAHAGV